MKKNLFLALSCLISLTIAAQSSSFGIKAGANFSNIYYKNGTKTNYLTGLNGGLFSHIHLSKRFAFQPEIMYSRQGSKQTYSTYENKLLLDYINVPLVFQLMFSKGFRIEAGPQIGFLVSAKSKQSGIEKDVKSSFKTTDISFPLGLGYLSNSGLGIGGRWVPGFSYIEKSGESIANNVFQIDLFYQFKR